MSREEQTQVIPVSIQFLFLSFAAVHPSTQQCLLFVAQILPPSRKLRPYFGMFLTSAVQLRGWLSSMKNAGRNVIWNGHCNWLWFNPEIKGVW